MAVFSEKILDFALRSHAHTSSPPPKKHTHARTHRHHREAEKKKVVVSITPFHSAAIHTHPTLESCPAVAMYRPSISQAMALTGPRWHCICTTGLVMLGVHMVTMPLLWPTFKTEL